MGDPDAASIPSAWRRPPLLAPAVGLPCVLWVRLAMWRAGGDRRTLLCFWWDVMVTCWMWLGGESVSVVTDVRWWPKVAVTFHPERFCDSSQREILEVRRTLEFPPGENYWVKQVLSPPPLTCEISFRFD